MSGRTTWSRRGTIALVQVLGLTVWFSVSAVVPSLRQDWDISTGTTVWLTGTVQLGFVAGAVISAVTNLADRFPPHRLLAISALAAALCTAALGLFVDGPAAAMPLRFLTGLFLAGVYPVGIKLMASWSTTASRGRALGVLVGALTLGSMVPHLIAGFGDLPWRAVLLAAAGIGAVGALVAWTAIRPGPHLARSAPLRHPGYALQMFRDPRPRYANLGYFGHMWELYALWTWIPTFLVQAPGAAGFPVPLGTAVFLVMGVAGAAGCLIGGWVADRFGRPTAAVSALAVSGLCCATAPLAFLAGPGLLLVFCAVWGAAVIADSAVFSTALSETADTRFVGSALTAQTAIGFALTVVAIQVVPLVADAVGWQWAFLVLVPGPVIGAWAMARFGRSAQMIE